MIPKKIHYCWFGDAEMSPFIKSCIKTWDEYLPDYELVLWNEDNFDLNSVQFIKEAYKAKKWAFVADYVRFYALYTEGGLYLDTDVKILRHFPEDWFNYGFFRAHEVHPGLIIPSQINSDCLPTRTDGRVDGISILSAIMGAKNGHPFIKDCLDQYEDINFLDKNGKMMDVNEIIIGRILARVAIKYNYRFKDEEMVLKENMLILSSNVLVGNTFNLDDKSYAVHLINGSWIERSYWEKILYITRNNYNTLFRLLNFINKVRLKVVREISKMLKK